MDSKVNPTCKHGERNIFCPYYEDCLDYAVARSWKSWNCSECPHKMEDPSLSEYDYLIYGADLCYDLPSTITQRIRDAVFDEDHE
jgi:hypothetical protein